MTTQARTVTTTGGSLPAPTRGPKGVGFIRRVNVPYEVCVDRLTDWWSLEAKEGTIDIGRSRLIGPLPASGYDDDTCRIDVTLGRGSLRRALSMELELVRWSVVFGTGLELYPGRDIHPDKRYFREGHALLDRVVAVIEPRR